MEKKKILITGKGSYVGTNLIKWLKQWPDQYEVNEISVHGDEWKKEEFSKYDSVFHVAGIAHVSKDPKKKEQYYKINRDLTVEVAVHAKKQGVPQFIFMSSIIVYGNNSGQENFIDRSTIPKPIDFYGNSKLQAEEQLKELENEKFKVVIIRPPMIYGEKTKGNYPKIAKFVKIFPFFPKFNNERSMIYIENITELVRIIIKNEESGLFLPQNKELVNISELIRTIAEVHNKKVLFVNGFDRCIKFLRNKNSIVNKVYGNLAYAKDSSEYKEDYQVIDFKESIVRTEQGTKN